MRLKLLPVLSLLLCLSAATRLSAQLSGTVTVPGVTYPTIASVVSALNTSGVGSGGVTINIAAGYSETLTAPLSLTATGTASNQIIFQKSGAGADPLIRAYATGTATPSSAVQDGMWNLVGSDYVTINGIDLIDTNSANPATMEYGYGLFKNTVTDGCQNNTIKNCTVTLNRVNNAAGTAPMVDGSVAILMINATIAAQTTALTVTAAGGSNSRNKFYGNTVQNCNTGIALIGYAPSSASSLTDTLNDVGGTAAATGNTIINFGGGGTTSAAAGIRTLAQYAINVSYNMVNNNNGSGISHGAALRGIYINTAANAVETISNNTITMTGGGTTAVVDAIENAGGSGTGGQVTISGNNIINSSYNTSTTGAWYGIYNNGSAPDNLFINNNLVSGLSIAPSTAGSGAVYLIYNSATISVSETINGNTLQNALNLNTSGSIYAIYNNTSTNTYSILNNAITAITRGATLSGGMYGYYNFGGGSGQSNINNNRINNMINGTGTYYGLYSGTSSAQSVNYLNNNINNITCTGTMYGIYNSYGTLVNIGQDTIGNFTGGGIIYGIQAGASSTLTCNTYQNVLNTLYSTGSANVYGIYMSASSSPGLNNAYKNKIYDLQNSNAGGAVYGIYVNAGTTHNVYNNIIGDLKATNATGNNAVTGIYVNAGTTENVSYNTVRIAAASASTTTFGTSAIYIGTTSPAVTLRNNILVNVSTPGATGGVTTALRYTSTPTTSAYTTASNNNLFYAGAPGAGNLIYAEGTAATATNGQQTLAAYKTYIATRDASAVSENPPFLSTAGTSATFLHINPATPTTVESGGANIAGITDDFDGDIRQGNTGYTGTGTSPDIGADEFNGVSPAPKINSVTINPTGGQCTAIAHTVTANVSPGAASLTAVSLTYAFNGGTPVVVAMTGGSLTATSTWTATIPVATPANAVVTWNVSATDGTYTKVTPGTTYQDAPLLGITASISATALSTCSATSDTLKVSLASPLPATYTLPPAVSNPTTDEDLGSITITQGATVILSDSTPINSLAGTIGTAAGTPGSYSDFTAFGPYNVTAGQAYSFSASVLQQTTAYNNGIAIFIDYNRNGVFTDPGETVYTSAATTAGAHTETGTFTIPASAFNGRTRMRIVVNEGSVPTSPTTSVSYGEYEEYMLNISSANAGGGTTPTPTAYTFLAGSTIVGNTNPQPVNPTATTAYTAIVTASGCNDTSNNVTITVLPLPTAPVAANSSQCGTQVPTASVSNTNGFTMPFYKWYAAATGGTALQNSTATTYATAVSATTTFYVSVINPSTGCESGRTPVTVTVSMPDPVTAKANGTMTTVNSCLNVPVALTAVKTGTTNTYTYSWTASPAAGSGLSTAQGGQNISVIPTVAGTYVYTVTAVDASCTAISMVTVVVKSLPSISAVTASPSAVCAGGSTSLNVTPGAANITTYDVVSVPYNLAPTPATGVTYLDTNGVLATPLTGGSTLDDAYWTVTLPFTFSLYGTPYTTASIGTNGDVMFASLTTQGYANTWPATAAPTGAFAPLFGDLNDNAGNVNYFVTGTAPNRVMVINWTGVNWYSATPSASFQAKLYETTNILESHITSTTSGNSHLTGVQNQAGTVATQPAGRTLGTWTVTTPEAWQFVPHFNNIASYAYSPVGGTGGLTATTAAQKNPTTIPTATNTYTVTVTDSNGCTGTGNVTVTVNPLPVPVITGPTAICAGSTGTLAANTGTGLTYQWNNTSGPISGATSGTYTVSAAGTYSVTETTASGCTATSAATTITVNPLPTATVAPSPTVSFCTGGSTVLTANAGTGLSYQWKQGTTTIAGATNQTYTVNAAGSYAVVVTNSATACSATSTATTVAVLPLPTAAITPSPAASFCSGGNVLLSANTGTGFTYQWNNAGGPLTGATNATYTVSTAGNYTVTVNNGACSATSVVTTVTVNPLPTATVTAGGATAFCAGGSVALSANTGTGFSYQWNTAGGPVSGATNATYTANTTGNYSVSITNNNGCTATSAATVVTVNPLPAATISPSGSASICANSSIILTANGGTGLTYIWKQGGTAIPGATSGSYTATAAGSYTVTVTNISGCQQTSAPTTITVNPLPVATLSPSPSASFCAGGSTTLTAPAGTGLSYAFTGGGVTTINATGTLLVSAGGTYTVMVTNTATGCSATSVIPTVVTVNPLPAANIAPAGTVNICNGGSQVFTANAGAGLLYQWYNGTALITGATGSTYTAGAGGSYSVKITNANGCSATSAATMLTISSVAAPVVSASGPTTFCSSDSVSLSTPLVTGNTYIWMKDTIIIPGATTSAYTVHGPGSYTVTVTNVNGCFATSAATVITNYAAPAAMVTPTGNTPVCSGDVILLTGAASSGNSYQWYKNGVAITGATGSTYNTGATGSYTLAVTGGPGNCTAMSAPTVITLVPLPVPVVTRTGDMLSTGSFTTYQWYQNNQLIPGATAQTYRLAQTGSYTVVVTSGSCSNTSAQFRVQVLLGVGNVGGERILIYPNPASTEVHVKADIPVNLALYTLEGKLLVKESQTTTVDIAAYPDGVYMLQVTDKNGTMLMLQKITKAAR